MIILISWAFRSPLKFFIKLVHFLMFFSPQRGGPFGDDDDDDDEDHDMFSQADFSPVESFAKLVQF